MKIKTSGETESEDQGKWGKQRVKIKASGETESEDQGKWGNRE